MNTEAYLTFKEKCVDELYNLQEEFKRLYGFAHHTEWYYDHGLGIFSLLFEDHAYYFEYVDVGSYSHNTKTWKWSWDNEHTPEKVKKGMEMVPLFGKGHKYDELTTGLIDGERGMGWEMAAIANTFIKGFGAYRAPSDHLDIYFLFTKEVDKEAYDRLKKKYLACGEHGSRRRAVVCQHLRKNVKTGFEEAFPTYPDMDLEEDEDLQTWCEECEKVRVKHGGWNDESEEFANIRFICEDCYFEIKEYNLGYREG